MKISTNWRLLLATLATAVLTACGGGSSQAPADTKTTIKVDNAQNLNLVSASIVTKDDKTIYTGDLSCDGSTCYIYLPMEVTQGAAIRFLDSNNKLAGAFLLPTGIPSYKTIKISNLSTGIYLVNRLSVDFMSKDGVSWQNLESRLKTFFTNHTSSSGVPDPYEEVGIIYAHKLKTEGMSDDQYLAALRLRLLNWDVASVSELPPSGAQVSQSPLKSMIAWFDSVHKGSFSFVKNAHAQTSTSSCSSGMQAFLGQAQNVGGMFPYVGGIIAGITQIFQDACGTTGDTLEVVLAKLDTLQASVDMLGQNVGALTEFLTGATANEQTVQFENLRNRANTVVVNYQQFLKRNNATSLVQYFQARGGWNKGIAEGGTSIYDVLYAPYKSSADTQMLRLIADTTGNSNFKTYLSALKSRCFALPNSSAENFVAVRVGCNAIIASNTAFLLGTQTSMLPIFQDIYAVLDLYQDVIQQSQAKVSNDFPLPPGVNSYATAVADIKTIFSTQQEKMITDYNGITKGKGLFAIYDGLNTDLMSRMVARDCMQAGSIEGAYPAISGWYAPNTNVNDNYLVTDCKNNSGFHAPNATSRSKARYYYNSQGDSDANDPANVLGVLVPSGIVVGQWREYRLNNASINTDTASSSGVSFGVIMPWVVSFNNENRRDQYVVKSSDNNGGSAAFRINGGQNNGYYVYNRPDGIGATNFTWFSFVDKNQFTYVTYLYVNYYGYSRNEISMACASYDCSVTSDSQALQYKNGPEVKMNDENNVYLKN